MQACDNLWKDWLKSSGTRTDNQPHTDRLQKSADFWEDWLIQKHAAWKDRKELILTPKQEARTLPPAAYKVNIPFPASISAAEVMSTSCPQNWLPLAYINKFCQVLFEFAIILPCRRLPCPQNWQPLVHRNDCTDCCLSVPEYCLAGAVSRACDSQ